MNNSLLLAHVFHDIFWVYLFSCVTSCVVSCGGNITDDMWLQICIPQSDGLRVDMYI